MRLGSVELLLVDPARRKLKAETAARWFLQVIKGKKLHINSHFSGPEQWLYHRQSELSRVNVTGPLACNQYGLLQKAALCGAGSARLPSYMLHDELADGRLRWLLRDYQARSTPVFLVHPYQTGLPGRTQVLADFLPAWFERSRQLLAGIGV